MADSTEEQLIGPEFGYEPAPDYECVVCGNEASRRWWTPRLLACERCQVEVDGGRDSLRFRQKQGGDSKEEPCPPPTI